jgi:hypothetical protein
MGVDEFRSELSMIKDSFRDDLIPNTEIYEKMCIDAQRRNLSNLASMSTDHPPLSITGVKRLLWPVFVTTAVIAFTLTIFVGFLYRSLSLEMSQKVSNDSYTRSIKNDSMSVISSQENNFLFGPENSSAIRNFSVASPPLYYLSTGDGILSHFFQLQHLWSITQSSNRALVPVSFHSPNHHHDVDWINLCDIFEFPADILCSGSDDSGNDGATSRLNRSDVVETHTCTMLAIYPWAQDPRLYGLPSSQSVEHKFDFSVGDCVAGYVDHKSGFTAPDGLAHTQSTFPQIKFTEKYVQIVRDAKASLGLNHLDNYSVVHWTSDDNLRKAKDCDISRLNAKNQCLTHHHFIQNVHHIMNISNAKKGKLTYLLTAERNASILDDFKKANFTLLSDIDISHGWTTVDAVVFELGLMLDSTFQIFWGQNMFKSFTDLASSQNFRQFRVT